MYVSQHWTTYDVCVIALDNLGIDLGIGEMNQRYHDENENEINEVLLK